MNKAYIAGLFDGEGCVNLSRTRDDYFIRVFVTNTNREILEDFKKQFGGDISLGKIKEGWKQSYHWRLSWNKAVEFLDYIYPYLRIKYRQAETAFAWSAIRPGKGNKRNQEYYDALNLIKDRITWLNKKGLNNEPDPILKVLEEL